MTNFLPYAALLLSLFTLLWIELRPHREAAKRRKELLKRHPELKRHLR